VDSDEVDLVLAVAQLHNKVDNSAGVSSQGSFRRLVGCRSADYRARPLAITGGDLTDLLRRCGRLFLQGHARCCRRGLRSTATRVYGNLRGLDGRLPRGPQDENVV